MSMMAKDGGTKSKTKEFMAWPYSNEREEELLTEVTKSGKWWRMNGNKVKTFEQNFKNMLGVNYCIGVTNGTHAIELALAALGVQAADEVILPAFTFISTLTAVIYSNAIPVIVDVDEETFCMDPVALERAVTKNTKAIIPVHMAGQCCNMDEICRIARKYDLKIIEDAAHAHGAEWNNRKAGSYGDIATFSFQNGKIMTCGEGGALVTNDKELYEKAFLIHGVGRPDGDRKYEHLLLGSNYRMNEFQAAILIAQLERLENQNKKRIMNACILDQLLQDIDGIRPQKTHEKVTLHSHYMYMFYYEADSFNGIERQEFVDLLISEGIPAFISYPVISETRFYKERAFRGYLNEKSDFIKHDLHRSSKIANEVVWLPHFVLLGDTQDLQEIADAIKKIQVYSYTK